jgi:predicted ATPase
VRFSIARASAGPLLLVTEDLHWGDRATIQLIDYVAAAPWQRRFMWLASFRLAEVVALDHPLKLLRHELRLHDLCEEIVLDPFSEREVADYVAERFASDRQRRSVRARVARAHRRIAAIHRIRYARAERARNAQSGGRVAPSKWRKSPVPENLAAIIEHYIAKLENDQRTLLSAAAVCGVQFRVNTIASALERDAAWVE